MNDGVWGGKETVAGNNTGLSRANVYAPPDLRPYGESGESTGEIDGNFHPFEEHESPSGEFGRSQ